MSRLKCARELRALRTVGAPFHASARPRDETSVFTARPRRRALTAAASRRPRRAALLASPRGAPAGTGRATGKCACRGRGPQRGRAAQMQKGDGDQGARPWCVCSHRGPVLADLMSPGAGVTESSLTRDSEQRPSVQRVFRAELPRCLRPSPLGGEGRVSQRAPWKGLCHDDQQERLTLPPPEGTGVWLETQPREEVGDLGSPSRMDGPPRLPGGSRRAGSCTRASVPVDARVPRQEGGGRLCRAHLCGW